MINFNATRGITIQKFEASPEISCVLKFKEVKLISMRYLISLVITTFCFFVIAYFLNNWIGYPVLSSIVVAYLSYLITKKYWFGPLCMVIDVFVFSVFIVGFNGEIESIEDQWMLLLHLVAIIINIFATGVLVLFHNKQPIKNN